MKVTLLTFASASDAVGSGELEIELPAGSDVDALKSQLDERYPALRGLWHRLAVAVDGEIAEDATPLAEGDEVALLPPVSGGSEGGGVALVEEAIDVASLLAGVASPRHGAVVLFVGNVRDHHAGRQVLRITYSAYRTMAETRLQAIVDDLHAADRTLRVAVVHRLGPVPAGEASVAIAVASPHRAAAYEASRRALERLKAEVPIWKREHYAGGEVVWREEESLLEPVPRHPPT